MSRATTRDAIGVALSQHFLGNPSVPQRIVASSGLAPPETVYEVGAGTGVLTAALAQAGFGRVIAIEKDPGLVQALCARFGGCPGIAIVEADVLAFRFPRAGSYAVIGNPPFAITSPLMRHLLSGTNPPRRTALVLQREAALRWSGLGEATAVSIAAQTRFAFEVLLPLHRREFTPHPRADCVLLGITARRVPLIEPRLQASFERFVQCGFGHGRGSARRNLAREVSYGAFKRVAQEHGLAADARPGLVPLAAWLALFEAARHRR